MAEDKRIYPTEKTGSTYRLDTCSNGDSLDVLRLSRMQPGRVMPWTTIPASYTIVTASPDAVTSGLGEALSSGDGNALSLSFPSWDDNAYKVVGKTIEGEVLAAIFEYSDSLPGNIRGDIRYGALEIQDTFPPVAIGECVGEEENLVLHWAIPTSAGKVDLELKSCYLPDKGMGPGERIRLQELTVVDTGAPGPEKGKRLTFKPGDNGFAFLHTASHHNVCVNYFVKLPHAVYGLSVLGAAGNIGAGVDSCIAFGGAPEIPSSSKTKVAFSFGYGGEVPTVMFDSEARLEKRKLP